MKLNKIQLYALAGILGSVLMFTGDMLLYYEPVSGKEFDAVAVSFSVSIQRLTFGGLIGFFAAVFSIAGGYAFYLIFKRNHKSLAKILFATFGFIFIVAVAYHAEFANYGFLGRLPEPLRTEQIQLLRSYRESMYEITFASATVWTLILFYLVIFKKTYFPKWMLLITPSLLILIGPFLKDYIPYPLGAIIYGGWINLCFLLFFIVCFLNFRNKNIGNDPVTSP